MSKNPESRSPVCGNCKHFVAGGLCELVEGKITSEAICDLHAFGNPRPIDIKLDPKYKKTDVNYRTGSFSETISGELVAHAIQMEHELLSRGIPEEEVHRAVIAYFSSPEPPPAMPWPGPVTGIDLMAQVPTVKVPSTREPLTNFAGLPANVEPYPTSNKSAYGIGGDPQPYPSNPTPDPNSLGNLSNTYDVLNPPNPYYSENWVATASDVNSEPSMHGEYGFNIAKAIPEWRYNVEQSQVYPPAKRDIIIPPSGAILEAKKDDTKKKLLSLMAKWAILLGGLVVIKKIIKDYIDSGDDKPLEIVAEYQYHGHENDDPCKPFNGKRFNLLETHNRPVIPSEKLGYTTTHPNCKCTWDVKPYSNLSLNKVTKSEQGDITKIEHHIKDAAKKGKLHKVEPDGKLSSKTTKKNPIKEGCGCLSIPSLKVGLSKRALQEAITSLRHEFEWLTEDYVNSAKRLTEEAGGQLYLVRAASESITDHRSEGEPYRRKLSAEELYAMTRTAITKGMDINHQPEWVTDATILDAEFNTKRKEIQMLVIEKDHEINQAIEDGKITAVSINGGMPRTESVEPCIHDCSGNSCELCVVPKGVVLGELDGIAMTWVVTDPNGIYWDGNFIPKAEPGIKITKIEAL